MGLPEDRKYKYEDCKICGTCLESCPVLKLDSESAALEIKKIREGHESFVLKKCTTCHDCDFSCPNDCHPCSLILERWSEIYSSKGIPARAKYFLPHSKPNFRTYVIERMTPREKGIIRTWSDLTPHDHVCYPGCNIIATPVLTDNSFFKDLEIRGGLEYCCGEMYYRMGLFEQVEQVAKKTEAYFKRLRARKVTVLCTAGYYMFTNVLPRFGARYDFEAESYLTMFLEKIRSGNVKFTTPLNIKVTLQDSCYGKQFGNDYLDIPREILAKAGCDIVEMKYSRECMMCCGIGAGFSPYSAYNPFRLLAYTSKVLKEAKRSGAEAIAVYCSGCLQMFATCMTLYRPAMPVYHIIELMQLACGEEIDEFHSRVGKRLLAGTLRHQTIDLLSTKRIQPPKILSEARSLEP